MLTVSENIDEISRNVRIESARADLTDRTLEIERAALSAYVWDYVNGDASALECPDGYDDDWLSVVHRVLWRVIRSLRGDGHVVTPSSIEARIRDLGEDPQQVRTYIAALASTTPLGRPTDSLRLVREMANRRRLVDLSRALEERALELDMPPAQSIADVAADLEAIRLDRQTTPTTLKAIALRIADDLAKPLPCHPTGLRRLDEALGGGLYAGKLYGTAAKRKHAKTVTAGTIAANIAASGTPTLFFALEMGEEGIAQRIIARHLKTNSLAFLARDNPHLRDDVLRFAERWDMPLFFEDRPGLGFAEMKNLASEYVARHGVKVIIVDYWQLVGGRTARQSLVEHLDHVAQWLADFAKASGAAIWCPAQLNRDGDTRSGEGLRLACDMYLVQHKVTQPDGKTEGIWFDMQDSRYTPTTEIGSEECCPFFISRTGPHLAQFSG